MAENITNAPSQTYTKDEIINSNISGKITISGTNNSETTAALRVVDTIARAQSVASSWNIRDGSFINPSMKTGAADYMSNQSYYMMDMITFNRYSITAIYHGNWIFRKIVDKPAQDMWSSGIDISGFKDPNSLKGVYKRLARQRSDLIYATQQARLYGGAASLIMVDDGSKDLSQPLNLDKIKKGSKIRLFTTDRWFGLEQSLNELVTDYKSIDFGFPQFYNFSLGDISGVASAQLVKVHHTRVLRWMNRRTTRMLSQLNQLWGLSELEHIYQDLMNHENTKNSIASLLNKAILEIIKVSGMRGMMTGLSKGNASQEAQLTGQLAALTSYRSNNNMVLMDSKDEWETKEYSFSGLSDILLVQKDYIAGAAEMPQVLIFGDTKGGLTSDSPAELELYAGTILGKQDEYIRPILDKYLPILFRVEGLEVPEDLDYEFNPINELSLDKKSTLLTTTTNTANTLADMGCITRETVLYEIQQDTKSTGFGTNISERDFKLARMLDEADLKTPPDSEETESDNETDNEPDAEKIHDEEASVDTAQSYKKEIDAIVQNSKKKKSIKD